MKNYTVTEISKMLGTSDETVRRWIRSGKLKASQNSRKSGNSVSESDLQKFLKSMPKYASIASKGLIASLPGVGLSLAIGGLVGEWLVDYMKKEDELKTAGVTQDDVIKLLRQEISSHEEAAYRKKETISKLQEELIAEEQQIASLQEIIKQLKAQQAKEE